MDTSICARLREGVTTHTAAETRALAQAWGSALPRDTVIALHGDLGSGKTTFVQGLAIGLGITEPVTSPTFTLLNLHRGPAVRLIHLDAYRLRGDAELEALMLEDFLISPWMMAVEWPDRLERWLPPATRHLDLSIDERHRHTLRLRA